MENIKILHVGIFTDHEIGGDQVLKKGFIKNNCEVKEFDYRKIANEHSIEYMNSYLLSVSDKYDVVFIGKGELLYPQTLEIIQKKGIKTALWYGDIRKKIPEWLKNNMCFLDFFFMTSGGEKLKKFHEEGSPRLSAFFINPSEPDVVNKYKIDTKKEIDILFTGNYYRFADKNRKKILNYLVKNNIEIYGRMSRNPLEELFFKNRKNIHARIRGQKYFETIQSSKIGIGVNAFKDTEKYFSDRLMHYASFGTFFITYKTPKLEMIFDPKSELIQYNSIQDLKKKCYYYLENIDEREYIASTLEKKVLKYYNTTNVTKYLLDIIKTNDSQMYEWKEIYKRLKR